MMSAALLLFTWLTWLMLTLHRLRFGRRYSRSIPPLLHTRGVEDQRRSKRVKPDCGEQRIAQEGLLLHETRLTSENLQA